ncbi:MULTISPECIES: TonB-dependent siderophore receptor [unclassified Nostoc]|uniref:TonB-dependent siderophore receptor n=1 Tax=unclassified Nostoc TaxID=2593658 RepID=UPI002637D7AA|nr:TonB-dependent siderophore receptor [Nostoc sp. S13]
MKSKQFVPSLLLTGLIIMLVTSPTRSEEIPSIRVYKNTTSGEADASSSQSTHLITKRETVEPIRQIRLVSQIEHPAQSARMLVQSPTPPNIPASEVVQVTSVKANPTAKGLEIILQTTKGEQLQLVNRTAGSNFITDIPNAQLRLASGEAFTFRSEKPIAGVTQITVTNFDANTIRVTVIGEGSVPTVELFDSPNEGLIFSVAGAASSAQQQPQTQTTPEQQKPGNQAQLTQPSASGDQPIELVVTGEQDEYSVPNATTATKTDTPLRDIPQSIQVIPQQVIKDQQITRITDAARNVSGVSLQGGYGANTDNYVIRGFKQYNSLRNGFQAGDNYIDPNSVERVEVLKGPASVLYGQFEPGGVVNYVTKQPLATPYYASEFTVGSYSDYKSSIDISGPLTPDQKLLYRLNASYENFGSFIDFVHGQYFSISPVLSYKISDNTNLTLEYEHTAQNRTFYDGLLSIPQSFQVPISRFLGEPSADKFNVDSNAFYLTLDHTFSENLRLRTAFSAYFTTSDNNNVVRPYSLEANGQTVSRTLAGGAGSNQTFDLQNELISKFKTGSINHQLLLGLELGWQNVFYDYLRTAAPGINLFNPVYGAPLPTSFVDTAQQTESYTDTISIYLQDQVTLLSNLKLLVGGRYDFVSYNDRGTDLNDNGALAYRNNFYDEAFSPRVGLVYQPIKPISLYASYSESFVPNNTLSASQVALKPSRGTQYEAGIKTELFDGKLSATLAAYNISKTNVATTDPNPNNKDYSIAAGEVKSQGIEFDIYGRILPGWNVIASFAHNDTYVSKDNNLPVGDRLVAVPRNTASFWTSYEIQSGSFKGLGFGGGLFFVGDVEANLPNNGVVLPSYVRTDASIFYKKENWRVGLNIKNLFDTTYYYSQGSYLRPGDPLSVLATISVQF